MVTDFAALFHHGNHIQFQFLHGTDHLGGEKPAVKQHIIRLDSCFDCVRNQLWYYLCCLFRGTFPRFCAVGVGINLTASIDAAVLLFRGQEAGIDRQEGHTVRPSQGQHTEATGKAVTGVVIDLCQQLHLFGTFARVNGIIHDECVSPTLGSQRCDGFGNNSGRQQSGKALPVNMGGVFQTVNRVLPEFRGLFRLHIQKHTAVAEDQTKQVLNQRNNRKSLFLVSVALLQNAADLILSEEFLDSGRKTLFIFNIKCYTVHSADPLYVFGILW